MANAWLRMKHESYDVLRGDARRRRLLRRREVDGVYRYAVAVPASELARRAVQQFVDDTLGGSLTPFVSYLAERESIDAAQMAELEQLLAKLRDRRGAEQP
jgi:predicted transcriptional regulator